MSRFDSLLAHAQSSRIPLSVQILGLILVGVVAYSAIAYYVQNRPYKQFPLIDLKEEEGLSPLASWMKRGEIVLAKGRRVTDGPFQVMTGIGPKIILPNRFAHELRNHDAMSFDKATATEFFSSWPGFEPFGEGLSGLGLVQEVIRVKITQSLNLITNDLVDECYDATRLIFPESKEWRSVQFKQCILNLIARLSSRVFLGKELCRNERWLEIAKDYAVHSFIAAMKLRFTPAPLRPLAMIAIKECRQTRQEVHDARKLIDNEVEVRKKRTQKALDAGAKPPRTADTIGWMHEICQRKNIKSDLVAAQLALSIAAIHTTTDALLFALMDCCRNPEIVQPLREEMIRVLREDGWSKTALFKMKLVDSLLKESQRYNSRADYTMNRFVTRDVELSDGTFLSKNTKLNVLATFMDPEVFPEPEKFIYDRFLKLRSGSEQGNAWQHVTTSPAHMGFGHGEHACPGRFFATNELKVALCFLLLNYDIKYTEHTGTSHSLEGKRMLSQNLELQYRSREPEIDLMNLSRAEQGS